MIMCDNSPHVSFDRFKDLSQDALTVCIEFCNYRILECGDDAKLTIAVAYRYLKASTKFINKTLAFREFPLRGGLMQERHKTISKKSFIHLLNQEIINMIYWEE
jgi:hypothetical protein